MELNLSSCSQTQTITSSKLLMNYILHLVGSSVMNITSLFSLPDPEQETVGLRKVEGGIAAVLKFSGKPTEEIVQEKAKELRSSLVKDGLKPSKGCLLARYNDPGRTWSFIMVSPKSMCLSIICCSSYGLTSFDHILSSIID